MGVAAVGSVIGQPCRGLNGSLNSGYARFPVRSISLLQHSMRLAACLILAALAQPVLGVADVAQAGVAGAVTEILGAPAAPWRMKYAPDCIELRLRPAAAQAARAMRAAEAARRG